MPVNMLSRNSLAVPSYGRNMLIPGDAYSSAWFDNSGSLARPAQENKPTDALASIPLPRWMTDLGARGLGGDWSADAHVNVDPLALTPGPLTPETVIPITGVQQPTAIDPRSLPPSGGGGGEGAGQGDANGGPDTGDTGAAAEANAQGAADNSNAAETAAEGAAADAGPGPGGEPGGVGDAAAAGATGDNPSGETGDSSGAGAGPGSDSGSDASGADSGGADSSGAGGADSGGADSGGAGGADSGGADSGGEGNYRGGVITRNKLMGPNPDGPDDGYGSLKVGEGVLTVKAMKHYGSAFLAKLNKLAVPKMDADDLPAKHKK